jgi:hypothetical protein
MDSSSSSDTVHTDAPVLSSNVKPDIVRNAQLHRRLHDSFIVKKAVNIWTGPKHPEYCELIDCVHSFKHVV